MRILALDIGEKRTGVACGDTASRVALPVCVLKTREVVSDPHRLRAVIDDHASELLLVGLPISLDGTEQNQAKRIRQLAESIAKTLDIPLVYQDERLSSAEAKRYLRESGCTEREMRGKIDMIAASLVLRAYLDSYKVEGLESALL